MRYKVILFDADGVVLVSGRFSDRYSQDHGVGWDVLKEFFQGSFQACKRGESDLKQELTKVLEAWKWQGSVDELMQYWFFIGSTPDPRAAKMIRDLRDKGVYCALASNQEAYRGEYLRTQGGMNELLDDTYYSCDLKHLKNVPVFFEMALKRLRHALGESLQASDVLFIDHDEENLAAARSVGLDAYEFHDMDALEAFLKT